MDYFTEDTEPKLSKYNSALSQLYRIDDLWKKCHFFRTHGNLIAWNHSLDCIWTELASDTEEEDNKKFNYFMKKIVENRMKRNVLNFYLMQKEIWLRKLQNKQGKGTAYADGSEDDFE